MSLSLGSLVITQAIDSENKSKNNLIGIFSK